jgi:hypothetical protein
VATNLVAQIANEFISGNTEHVVDAVTFVEASWGLGINLLPVQRFMLKAFYGMPLDASSKNITVPDILNEKVLYTMTEHEFLHFLKEEGRCNTDVVEGKNFHEMVLVLGRRGTKCRDMEDRIATTVGSITFGELARRLKAGERIGIGTYDQSTLKHSISYEAKAEFNGEVECFEVVTGRGICETSSWNHPYLVWRDAWERPRFIDAIDLIPGDRISIAASTKLFGPGSIGVKRAALLGHLQGDGGTTCSVGYTTKCPTMLADFTDLIQSEFPGYVVCKKGAASWRFGYEVVKGSKRFKQNGSQKNEVRDWLRSLGCFGKKAIVKQVPDCIYRGSREEIAAFVSRLFGCDGHANVEKTVGVGHGGVPKSHVGFCSASKELVDGVRHLLQKFGIHGVVGTTAVTCDGKKFKAWTYRIVRRECLEKFNEEIGIFSKEVGVRGVIDAARLRGDSKGELDCIPKGVWTYVKKIQRERGLSGSAISGGVGGGSTARIRWSYAPSRWKVTGYGHRIHDDFLTAMGESDVLWDKVREVRPVGKRMTVDVEVPGTHVIGGDIVSHNSTLASCISNYELYKLVKRGDPASYYGFPQNAEISILNVAPTDDQAGIVFGMIQSMALKCPYLRDRSLHQTMTYFDLQTDSDRKTHGRPRASLLSIAGGCSSNALRGRNAIIVILDEMAFFIDKDNSRFSGGEVYKALTPSMASFGKDGKVVCLSSPYAKFGRFYERYMESFNEPDYALMFRMYTALANPTVPSEILRAAYRRDRSSFMCEYGGDFSDRVTAWVELESELKKCVVSKPPPTKGKPDTPYYMGIDLGFQNDGTSIAIVHREGKKVVLDHADVWFSGSSDVWEFEDSIYSECDKYKMNELLRMSDVVQEVKRLCRWFPIKRGIFDQSNGYALSELLNDAGFTQFDMVHFSDQTNHEVYELVKRLYSEWLIELYDHPILIPEMLSLEATRRNKARVDVAAPDRRGAHDDISDAYTRAVWACYNVTGNRTSCRATGAGGISGGSPIGRIGAGCAPKVESQNSFAVKRLKMHGPSPRPSGLLRGGRR